MSDMAKVWEALEVPDGVRAEFVGGKIVMQANPTALHDLPVRSIVRQVGSPYEAWGERGIELAEDSRPRADVVIVAEEDVPLDLRDWPSSVVLVVVEVVSGGRGAWRDDWETKRELYQEARIPTYVIVDPRDATWHVLRLDGHLYVETGKGIFGQPIELEPVPGSPVTIATTGWHPYPAP